MPEQSPHAGKRVGDTPELLDGPLRNLLANEEALYFERAGPYYRLMQRIGWIQGENLRRQTS